MDPTATVVTAAAIAATAVVTVAIAATAAAATVADCVAESEGRGAATGRGREGGGRRRAGRRQPVQEAVQEADHTRPKSMWSRVTSRSRERMAQVEQASACAVNRRSAAVRRTVHSAGRG
ncbi:hypothetical protein GCM10010315_49620 [Streptomyces luteosporeus]|uniref:Secreted protein n=1 Tax=Streptomyces luteosporeus TaxID=173856 RepID=A0ABN3U1S2_9ACTN